MRDDRRCERYEELLPDLLDGILPEDHAAEVRGHVERCDACRRSLEALGRLERELCRLPSLTPDGAAVAAAVTGRLGLERRSRAASLVHSLPLERLALPLGIAAIVLSTFRYFGGMAERLTAALTSCLSGLAGAFEELAATSPSAVDSSALYLSSALILIGCAALSLTALRIVRR
ncbi:MAG: zf-HC2 domain-containing protein [Candidatus Krumholzibacteria bacterium]|nr:zf-HC2 domain-containing protein [Candidatus Krumholzibacteria bacterium]